MILATKLNADYKGKDIIKTANEFIYQEFTVKKIPVGQVELYYFDDANGCKHKFNSKEEDAMCTICGEKKNDLCEEGEWLIKFRRSDEDDWDIIAQGNI